MKPVIDVNSIVPMHVTSKKGPQSLRRCLSVKQIGLILHVTLYEQVVFALVTCHAEVKHLSFSIIQPLIKTALQPELKMSF